MLSERFVYNIFPANFKFTEPLPDVDFFKIKNVFPRSDRYKLVGRVAYRLERLEKAPFAQYFPSPEEDFLIGFLPEGPTKTSYQVNGMSVEYEGRRDLKPTNAGKRAILELIYKIQRKNLENKGYWEFAHDIMFPTRWKNLFKKYMGRLPENKRKLNLFRGPHFNYSFLSDGQLILILDTTTHMISSEPFIKEINRKGNLEWFEKEIAEEKERYEGMRRKFYGIYFHYPLLRRKVNVTGVDPRPISKIPVPKTTINGEAFEGSVLEYLQRKYPEIKSVQKLNGQQPGLKDSRGFTYAPALLYRHVGLEDIPAEIKNEEMHLVDTRGKKDERDIQRPAHMRWKLIQRELVNFQVLELGQKTLTFYKPLTAPSDANHHFERPRLLVQKDGDPVNPDDLVYALRKGPYKPPDRKEILFFSTDDALRKPFWLQAKAFFERNFSWTPPEYIPIETSEGKIRIELEKIRSQGKEYEFACLGIGTNQYKMLKNICGEFNIPVQYVRLETAYRIVESPPRFSRYLEGICAGLFAKMGGIPWLLYDELNYERYAAVDVGRMKAEWWAMGIVSDKKGRFNVYPGEILKGEDLDSEILESIISRAIPDEDQLRSFILLRDGDISERELEVFQNLMSGNTNVRNCGIAWIKKSVPCRIFRESDGKMLKPYGGDFVKLDETKALICCAGIEEYEHAMPKPLMVEISPVKGELDIRKIVRDVFYMSYLNWGSPSHSYSSPAPLRLCSELASSLAKGIRPAGPPF